MSIVVECRSYIKFNKLSYDNSKLVERQGRKAKGPVKWQPATER